MTNSFDSTIQEMSHCIPCYPNLGHPLAFKRMAKAFQGLCAVRTYQDVIPSMKCSCNLLETPSIQGKKEKFQKIYKCKNCCFYGHMDDVCRGRGHVNSTGFSCMQDILMHVEDFCKKRCFFGHIRTMSVGVGVMAIPQGFEAFSCMQCRLVHVAHPAL